MGVRNIMRENPDIVISGINHGSNTATNVIYSGTVSAAREAAIMDIPAIAISIADHDVKDFALAAKTAARFTQMIKKRGLKKGTLLNINVPNVSEDKIKGTLVTRQGRSKWDDVYEKRVDPYGRNYYWLTGNLIQLDDDLEYDQYAVMNNYISVSPIHFDLTDTEFFGEMKDWGIV
jgi:5'-nucleotidase